MSRPPRLRWLSWLIPRGHREEWVGDLPAFERSLVTPSRFDRFLRGNAQAISQEEAQGYTLFKNYGCVACHQGVNVGGNMYQQFGVMDEYFKARGKMTDADLEHLWWVPKAARARVHVSDGRLPGGGIVLR